MHSTRAELQLQCGQGKIPRAIPPAPQTGLRGKIFNLTQKLFERLGKNTLCPSLAPPARTHMCTHAPGGRYLPSIRVVPSTTHTAVCLHGTRLWRQSHPVEGITCWIKLEDLMSPLPIVNRRTWITRALSCRHKEDMPSLSSCEASFSSINGTPEHSRAFSANASFNTGPGNDRSLFTRMLGVGWRHSSPVVLPLMTKIWFRGQARESFWTLPSCTPWRC